MERDDEDKIGNFQKAIALVTAWIEHDEGGIELVNELVQAYAIEENSVARLIEGLLSLATQLIVELRKALPQYDTEEEILQALSTFWEGERSLE